MEALKNKYNGIIIQDTPMLKFAVTNPDNSEFMVNYKDNMLVVSYSRQPAQFDLINRFGDAVVYKKETNVENIESIISFLQGFLTQYNQL